MHFASVDVRDHIVSLKKRPPTFVTALWSIAATETTKKSASAGFLEAFEFAFFSAIRWKVDVFSVCRPCLKHADRKWNLTVA
jgi:hypothetical protein